MLRVGRRGEIGFKKKGESCWGGEVMRVEANDRKRFEAKPNSSSARPPLRPPSPSPIENKKLPP